MNAVFVLGSGISIPAGMPTLDEITKQVVSGEGVILQPSRLFRIAPDSPNYQSLRPGAVPPLELISDLHDLSANYFRQEPNYEQISQVAREVADTISREYGSPAVLPLIEQLRNNSYASGNLTRLHEVNELAHRYIKDMVHQSLSKTPSRLDHLDVIVEACKSLSAVTLATLNHDLLLEQALEDAHLAYADGFERTKEDVRYWVDEWEDAPIQLLKLHGSLDWWGYEREERSPPRWDTGRYMGADPMRPSRPRILGTPQDMRPIFLTGTFDKILAYETWIFPDQHVRFHEALDRAERVVVIGYGFGDKAINTRLIAWLARTIDRTLIICHPDPERLRRDAREAIQNHWDGWESDRQLRLVASRVEDLDYGRIAEHLA